MALEHLRAGRLGLPPEETRPQPLLHWLRRLSLWLDEMFAELSDLLPVGERRDALIHDGDDWVARSLDTFFWLGTGVYDGATYVCSETYPRYPNTMTGLGGIGSPPPDLNRAPIGTLVYFRADTANAGASYLNVHVDLPDITGLGAEEIVRPDGTSLVAGDIPEGAIVALVWDALTNGDDPPGTGTQAWRMLGVLTGVPATRNLTAGVGLSGGGDLSADRTFDISWTELTAETTPATGDLVAVYDDSAAAYRKMTLANLLTLSHTHSASDITSGQLALARGGTAADLSATGGASQVLKQTSVGGAVTVGTLSASDVGAVPTSRTLTAGTGLTGGGDLSADRTISLSVPVSLANGGTGADLSATGGTGQFLRQSSAGAAITVSAIAHADLGSGGGTGTKYLRDDMTWQTVSSGVTDHGALTGLGDDDHTQYALLAGRSGGQTLIGGTGSGDGLTLRPTSHSTAGQITLGPSGLELIHTGSNGQINITASATNLIAKRSDSAGVVTSLQMQNDGS